MEFDSVEENQIHEMIIEEFENVIYNQRNSKYTVKIDGMVPDWLLFTDNKCWLIEYFGMYLVKSRYNKRIDDYIKKSDSKMEKYSKLDGYGKLFLFPEDMANNLEGVREKLKMIS